MFNPIRILQVSTSDIRGGAERIAYNLNSEYRNRGHFAWLTVGHKYSDNPYVINIRNDIDSSFWASSWSKIGNIASSLSTDSKLTQNCAKLLKLIGQPHRLLDTLRGHEDFYFPGTWKILDLIEESPDIIHCHNLHGYYFDLRALPWLSKHFPVVFTLHDQWMSTGHCSYSFDCDRWLIGCGRCPDLTIYPSVIRDATDYNWKRKRDIFSRSRFYLATPSQWLMQKAEKSIIAPGIVNAQVIPYGVDQSIFNISDKMAARSLLGIPNASKVILFTAQNISKNPFKDYPTVKTAVELVGERLKTRDLVLMTIGADMPNKPIDNVETHFLSFESNPEILARYYQSADLFIHAANADNFPNTILEALACGTPVVTTAVGGIPEQIKPLKFLNSGTSDENYAVNSYTIEEATGILVPRKDSTAMAEAILILLSDDELRKRLGENASRDAKNRFDLKMQVDKYLDWYETIIEEQRSKGKLTNSKLQIN